MPQPFYLCAYTIEVILAQKKQSRASGTAGMKLEPICKRHVIGPEFRTIALAADC